MRQRWQACNHLWKRVNNLMINDCRNWWSKMAARERLWSMRVWAYSAGMCLDKSTGKNVDQFGKEWDCPGPLGLPSVPMHRHNENAKRKLAESGRRAVKIPAKKKTERRPHDAGVKRRESPQWNCKFEYWQLGFLSAELWGRSKCCYTTWERIRSPEFGPWAGTDWSRQRRACGKNWPKEFETSSYTSPA